MISDELLEAVDGLGTTPWTGSAFRHTTLDRNPLEGSGAWKFGGRWNPKELVSTIYLAEPLETCVAEFFRMAEGQGRGPSSFLPRVLHELRCEDLELVDLRPVDALTSVGLSFADITDQNWAKCQTVGEAVHFLERQGIVAPSATGSGIVIAVFEPRVRPGQLTLVHSFPLEIPEPS